MNYVEIAVSDGPGTLIRHIVTPIENAAHMLIGGISGGFRLKYIAQTLTKSEAQEWHDIHGGWVAV